MGEIVTTLAYLVAAALFIFGCGCLRAPADRPRRAT